MEEGIALRLSPLNLAYMGDAVFELFIRRRLLLIREKTVDALTKECMKFVCAPAQARMGQLIFDQLTEEEQQIYRRGRNAFSHSIPKHASRSQYRYATAFEALIGYVYLENRQERLEEIVNRALELWEREQKENGEGLY